MIRARVVAICCGFEDTDDVDALRTDLAFKLACGQLPDSGIDLSWQPTLSRLENAARLRDVIRLTYALVDAWMGPGKDAKVRSWLRARRMRFWMPRARLHLGHRGATADLPAGGVGRGGGGSK